MNNEWKKKPEESTMEYINRICTGKQDNNLTWKQVQQICNKELGIVHSDSWYRKGYKNGDFAPIPVVTSGYIHVTAGDTFSSSITDTELQYVTTVATSSDEYCNGDCENCPDFIDCLHTAHETLEEQQADVNNTLFEIRKEKVKLADEKNQTRAYVRRIAREETIKEIASNYASVMNKEKKLFAPPENYKSNIDNDKTREGILLLSDWHYGFDFVNPKNKFNTDICQRRVSALVLKTCELIHQYKLQKVHVLNLSDLIAGRIHLTIRLESREDTITQIMEVSEILAEAINLLSAHCQIEYHQVNDNHSRLEPNKGDSLELETLCRITPWFLKSRLATNSNVFINDTEYSNDIALFDVLGHKIAAVHGDKDKPEKIVTNLSRLTGEHFQLICAAHNHHFSATEENDTLVVFNGSLMGTDNYAFSLRLHSTPSQTLIVVSPKNVTEAICRIPLKI